MKLKSRVVLVPFSSAPGLQSQAGCTFMIIHNLTQQFQPISSCTGIERVASSHLIDDVPTSWLKTPINIKTVTSSCEMMLRTVHLKVSLLWPLQDFYWKLRIAASVNEERDNSFRLDRLLSRQSSGNRSQLVYETGTLLEIPFSCWHLWWTVLFLMLHSEDELSFKSILQLIHLWSLGEL